MKRRIDLCLTRRAGLCALSLLSLAFHFEGAPEKAAILPDAAVWALGLWGLWMLYGALEKLPRAYCAARFWVLAALLGGIVTLGQSFASAGTAELVLAHKLKAVCFFAGRVPLYYAGMRRLESALSSGGEPAQARAWTWACGLAACWLPWYICVFPGTVSNDSITQLKELLGILPLSNGNPLFQTALIELFRRLGEPLGGADAAVAMYCVVQAALMAWLLGALLKQTARAGAPKWLRIGMFVFYGFCPVFPLFAFCVGKDTNFAMAVLFLSLTVWRVLRAQGRVGARDWVCLCVSGVLCALLRNPGVYLAALTLALLLVWSIVRRKDAWRAALCALSCVAGAYLALNLLVIPSLGAQPMPETENYSIPLQQVARAVAGGEVTDQQRAAIDGVLEYDKLQAAYNGELSDPIKLLWRADATAAQKNAFWKTWLDLLRQHPATCLSATFHNTYGYLYPGYMSTIKPTLLIGLQGHVEELADSFAFSVNPLCELLKSTTQSLSKNALYRVLVSPGLYGWLTLFAFAALRRRKRNLLPAVPALFTLAGCLLSAVNAYFRYAMPLYLCAPLLLALCASPDEEKDVQNS